MKNLAMLTVASSLLFACVESTPFVKSTVVATNAPLEMMYEVKGSLTKQLQLTIDNPENYASISIYGNDELLLDNVNIATTGKQQVNALIKFNALGEVKLKIKANNANVIINDLALQDIEGLTIPHYQDISVKAGIDKVSSIKYGGPTVADIDNDGDYDFIVNNHNEESSKLYWNNGDGTVTKHSKDLARWFMHDLHGTSAGDYDNDGDLDLVVTQGGGNGKDPSKANFYTHVANVTGKSQNNTFVLTTGDVGIDRGGRGRGAKWTDMDLDGDLDLMLINETSLRGDKPQHFFYENKGDGSFVYKAIEGLQDQHPSRALITDLNNDNIDDVILYGPLSVWQGNGDFTFTDITSKFSADTAKLRSIMAIVDIDIDNDGDLDLYLARGKEFELGKGEAPSVDHDPLTKEFSIKPRGFKGIDSFSFTAENNIRLHNYYYLAQGEFRGKDYPIFLGSDKAATKLNSGEALTISAEQATGWPESIVENGIYFGHIGDGQWKSALVRNGDIFWNFKFSLSGVSSVSLDFQPENRNISDVLLRNDGDKFTDVSRKWNIPNGGNSLGVTRGDFNNDSHQDLFVYRWGNIGARISDVMLLNDGNGQFQNLTMHGANDVGGPGNGDMGQAFDFDLDGDIDLLNGSEGGEWYLYENSLFSSVKPLEKASEKYQQATQDKTSTHANPSKANTSNTNNNYVLVNVGYSPIDHIDAISAQVVIETANQQYSQRVGSAGAIFSQSLLNIVHFGLGSAQSIKSIKVRWRNGETIELSNKPVNALYQTDQLDPTRVQITPDQSTIRKGTSLKLTALLSPKNANKNMTWTSSNNAVLTVDEQGVVAAVGDNNQSATISATSVANGLSTSTQVSIVDWFAVPVESVSIMPSTTSTTSTTSTLEKTAQAFYIGQTLSLQSKVSPSFADNNAVKWLSSDPSIATVDEQGIVSALSVGDVRITAVSDDNPQIRDAISLQVKPYIEGYIKFEDEEVFKNKAFVVGEKITVNANYHAGSGNRVISSDEGGIRFWLRHFKSKWIPVKDIVLTDASVLKTQSGNSQMTFTLDNITPTEQLPEGHFYQLRVSFTASDGKMHDSVIYPLTIVDNK